MAAGPGHELTAVFGGAFAGELRAPDELGAALVRALTTAHASWPADWLDGAAFARAIAAGLAADADPVAAVREVRAGDLYLALACAARHPAAIAVFEDHYMPVVTTALRGMRGSEDVTQEVAQQIRERLLVGDGERGPRIGDYAGRGDLRRWVKTAAVHTFFNLRKRAAREVGVEDSDALDALATPDVEPELAHMKQRYRDELHAAFTSALAELDDRSRALLRYRYVDGLEVEKIAAIYKVHRGTLHRWLAEARDALGEATVGALQRRLGANTEEAHSIRRLVQSQVEVSVSRLLGEKSPAARRT
jgi:RNA polymerase sigma-70 factor (ECF subfamily)